MNVPLSVRFANQPADVAETGRDIDRLIQNFYVSAVEEDWRTFRSSALETLCKWIGACAGAWLTHSSSELPGEFSVWPTAVDIDRNALFALEIAENSRDMCFAELPAPLRPAAIPAARQGYVLSYHHRGTRLRSRVLLMFPGSGLDLPGDTVRRAIGHMVEAGSLALRQYIQRDEWLHALGRPNRGTAALVDARSNVYAASRRFRDLMQIFGMEHDFLALPFELPDSVIDGESNSFAHGSIQFRVDRIGHLFQLHARRPLPLDGLSPREQQIARALGNGKTFKSVARQYDIAVSTVANHASRIYRKLGIYRREDLVELVRQPGAQKASDNAGD